MLAVRLEFDEVHTVVPGIHIVDLVPHLRNEIDVVVVVTLDGARPTQPTKGRRGKHFTRQVRTDVRQRPLVRVDLQHPRHVVRQAVHRVADRARLRAATEQPRRRVHRIHQLGTQKSRLPRHRIRLQHVRRIRRKRRRHLQTAETVSRLEIERANKRVTSERLVGNQSSLTGGATDGRLSSSDDQDRRRRDSHHPLAGRRHRQEEHQERIPLHHSSVALPALPLRFFSTR
mmetsp:Transcript_2116/g.7148  ORF Transcript_2116/g.7148 Transcript_2116/m.7148 type:complete len:230 (+) Transcript_2116:1787-2476(+)